MRFTGLRPTTQNVNRKDFILASNLGFDRSEHRDHQFSSLPIKFPMPAAHALEEINEKEGLGEMNFVTSHIGVQKQGKVSRVYFISTAQEASVPKIALIPASTPCYFWHLCKLICKKNPLGVPRNLSARVFYCKPELLLHCQLAAALRDSQHSHTDSSC